VVVSQKKNLKAIGDRLGGEPASRFRAVVMAGTAGAGVAALVYRAMHDGTK
jgi:hypothetical protein